MCGKEEHKRYRLAMEPGVLVAWSLRNQNISRQSDFIPYDQYRKQFNLQEKVVYEIDKKKEIEEAKKNTAWIKKPFKVSEIDVLTKKPKG